MWLRIKRSKPSLAEKMASHISHQEQANFCTHYFKDVTSQILCSNLQSKFANKRILTVPVDRRRIKPTELIRSTKIDSK